MMKVIYLSFLHVDTPAPTMIQHPAVNHSLELYTNNFNLTLQCEAVGDQVTYTWTKNGRIITPNNHFKIVEGDLYIINITKSDEGQYQCNASNVGGSVASSYAQVDIKGITVQCIYDDI